MLVAGRERQYLEAFFNARVFNPAGMNSGASTLTAMFMVCGGVARRGRPATAGAKLVTILSVRSSARSCVHRKS